MKYIWGLIYSFILLSNSATATPNFKFIESDSSLQLTYNSYISQLTNLGRFDEKTPDKYALRLKFMEETYSKIREQTIDFWKKHPNDTLKYYWFFEAAVKLTPNYWKNIDSISKFIAVNFRHNMTYNASINWKELSEWQTYYPEMKREYLQYVKKHNPNNVTNDLEVAELMEFIELSRNLQFRENNKFDFTRFCNLFNAALKISDYEMPISKSPDSLRNIRNLLHPFSYQFLSFYKSLGLSTDSVISFFKQIDTASSSKLKEWVEQNLRLLHLEKQPFTLIGKTIENKDIDLSKLQGNKIVLLDFWNIGCSYCIQRMHYLNMIHQKYKDKGFFVLSLCAEEDTNDVRSKVEKIKSKIGADWETMLIGEIYNQSSLANSIWKKYGFLSVPQIMLLNKEGKLVMYNDYLFSGDFESLIISLL